MDSAQEIADEYNVNEKTVRRAEKFVDAVDAIAGNVDEEARDEILSRELDATQDDVTALAKQSEVVQKTAVEKARSGTKLKQAIREAVKENRTEVEPPPLPEGKYRVILADPPWQYSNAGLGGAAERRAHCNGDKEK